MIGATSVYITMTASEIKNIQPWTYADVENVVAGVAAGDAGSKEILMEWFHTALIVPIVC